MKQHYRIVTVETDGRLEFQYLFHGSLVQRVEREAEDKMISVAHKYADSDEYSADNIMEMAEDGQIDIYNGASNYRISVVEPTLARDLDNS